LFKFIFSKPEKVDKSLKCNGLNHPLRLGCSHHTHTTKPQNIIIMIADRTYRKFKPQQKRIEELEQQHPRFRRVFKEYEALSGELWNSDPKAHRNLPDDFLQALEIQTEYLEEEIEKWLREPEC